MAEPVAPTQEAFLIPGCHKGGRRHQIRSDDRVVCARLEHNRVCQSQTVFEGKRKALKLKASTSDPEGRL
jgi:hypothetical protein